MSGQRPAQNRVLLVDQLAESRLGDRDEWHLVGDFEHGEPAFGGDLENPRRHLAVSEACAEAEGRELVIGEARHELALALRRVELHPSGQQDLASRQPRRRIEQLGDVDPAHGKVETRLASQQADVQVRQQVTDGQHAAPISRRSESAPPPTLGHKW